MGGFRAIFQGVEDPRKRNAAKHDLTEMLTVALLATLTGKSSCSSFARFVKLKYEFLSEFMELKGGPPIHNSFADLFNGLDPEQLSSGRCVSCMSTSATRTRPRAGRGGDSRPSPGSRTNAISYWAARSEKLSFNGRRVWIEKTGSRCGDDSFDVNGRSFTSVNSAPVDGGSCAGGVHPRHSGASASAQQRESLGFHSSDGSNFLEFGEISRGQNQSMIALSPQPFGPGFPERLRQNDKQEHES